MSKSDADEETTAVVARTARSPAKPTAPTAPGAPPPAAPATRPAGIEVDPDHLREAVAVSELTRMPDGGLAALRARRKKNGLDEEQLRRARDLLRLVGRSLVGPPDAARWQQIEAAWETLAREAPPPAPRDELPAPAPPPAPRPAPPPAPLAPPPAPPPAPLAPPPAPHVPAPAPVPRRAPLLPTPAPLPRPAAPPPITTEMPALEVEETAAIVHDAPAAALPFRAAATELAPRSTEERPAADERHLSGRTGEMSPLRGLALPFQKGPPVLDDETEVAMAPRREGPIPFVAAPGLSPEPAQSAEQVAAEQARPATPFRTLMQRAVAPAAPSGPVAPPAPPPPPAAPPAARVAAAAVARPELGVEQSAALFAECATAPEARAQIWARFGIRDEAEFRALEQAWRQRFEREPTLLQRWKALYEHYCRWFTERRSSKP